MVDAQAIHDRFVSQQEALEASRRESENRQAEAVAEHRRRARQREIAEKKAEDELAAVHADAKHKHKLVEHAAVDLLSFLSVASDTTKLQTDTSKDAKVRSNSIPLSDPKDAHGNGGSKSVSLLSQPV